MTTASSALSKTRYEGGVTTYLEVLDADRSQFEAEIELARARLVEMESILDLYRALGGGWEPEDPCRIQSTCQLRPLPACLPLNPPWLARTSASCASGRAPFRRRSKTCPSSTTPSACSRRPTRSPSRRRSAAASRRRASSPAGPREQIFFDPSKTRAGIVTCGGLCPGLNDVIRALVMSCTSTTASAGSRASATATRASSPRYGHEPVELTPDVGQRHPRGTAARSSAPPAASRTRRRSSTASSARASTSSS